jgi:hypothetical protein
LHNGLYSHTVVNNGLRRDKQFQIFGYEEIVHITCVVCKKATQLPYRAQESTPHNVKLLFSGENTSLMLSKLTEQMSSAVMY